MTNEFSDSGRCFVCGPVNPEGLRLEFRMDKDRGEAEAEVRFPDRYQGWEGVVHGGLLATVLDEAMIKAAWGKGLRCVTGEMTVRYAKPARTGVAFRLMGRVTGVKKDKMVFAESEILSAGGESVARATGKLFKVTAWPGRNDLAFPLGMTGEAVFRSPTKVRRRDPGREGSS